MVDGNVDLRQNRANHRHLHCSPQQHWLVFPCCVEETEVLNVDCMLDQQVEEEDGADEGEGEGEDAGAGKQEQRRHISIGQSNVVVLITALCTNWPKKECTHCVDGPVVDLCLLPGDGTLSSRAAALEHIPDILQGELVTIGVNIISWRSERRPEAVGEVSNPMKL